MAYSTQLLLQVHKIRSRLSLELFLRGGFEFSRVHRVACSTIVAIVASARLFWKSIVPLYQWPIANRGFGFRAKPRSYVHSQSCVFSLSVYGYTMSRPIGTSRNFHVLRQSFKTQLSHVEICFITVPVNNQKLTIFYQFLLLTEILVKQ